MRAASDYLRRLAYYPTHKHIDRGVPWAWAHADFQQWGLSPHEWGRLGYYASRSDLPYAALARGVLGTADPAGVLALADAVAESGEDPAAYGPDPGGAVFRWARTTADRLRRLRESGTPVGYVVAARDDSSWSLVPARTPDGSDWLVFPDERSAGRARIHHGLLAWTEGARTEYRAVLPMRHEPNAHRFGPAADFLKESA